MQAKGLLLAPTPPHVQKMYTTTRAVSTPLAFTCIHIYILCIYLCVYYQHTIPNMSCILGWCLRYSLGVYTFFASVLS